MSNTESTWIVESLPMESDYVCVAPLTQHGTIVAVGKNDLCHSYSPRHRRWQALPPMIEKGRCACGVVPLGDEIVALGGRNYRSFSSLSTVERLKLDDEGQPLGSWEVAPEMTQARKGCAAVVAEGNIVVVGGYDSKSRSSPYLSSAELFDPPENTWQRLPEMATKRRGCAAVAIGDKVYVFGGQDGSSNHNSAEYLCMRTKEWHCLPPMQKRRYWPAAAAMGGRILVVGGEGEDEEEEERYLSDVEVFDTSTMRWEEDHDVPSLNTGRCEHGATTVENRIYIVGGEDNNSNRLDTMEILEVQEASQPSQPDLVAEIAKLSAENAKLSAQIAQVNTTSIKEPSLKAPQPDYSEFKTRIDLEAEVAMLRKKIQDGNDSFELDAITLAAQAKKRLPLLEELLKTMPTVQKLRSDISDLEDRIRGLREQDRWEEAIPLARKRGELVEQVRKEETAEGQKTLPRPLSDRPR